MAPSDYMPFRLFPKPAKKSELFHAIDAGSDECKKCTGARDVWEWSGERSGVRMR